MSDDIEYVFERKVSCGGKNMKVSHPIIYMHIGDSNEVVCGYCGKKFSYLDKKDDNSDGDEE